MSKMLQITCSTSLNLSENAIELENCILKAISWDFGAENQYLPLNVYFFPWNSSSNTVKIDKIIILDIVYQLMKEFIVWSFFTIFIFTGKKII